MHRKLRTIPRRDPSDRDLHIEILFYLISRSDMAAAMTRRWSLNVYFRARESR